MLCRLPSALPPPPSLPPQAALVPAGGGLSGWAAALLPGDGPGCLATSSSLSSDWGEEDGGAGKALLFSGEESEQPLRKKILPLSRNLGHQPPRVMRGSLYYELRPPPRHLILRCSAWMLFLSWEVFQYLCTFPLSSPPELPKGREWPSYLHSVALGDGC